MIGPTAANINPWNPRSGDAPTRWKLWPRNRSRGYDDVINHQHAVLDMRTIIDLQESQIAALRELEKRKNVSRAELIRQAVALYVAHHAAASDAFGAWKAPKRRPVDGLAAQRKLRLEWDRE